MSNCDHKFIDSNRCVKCGWVPPPRAESHHPVTTSSLSEHELNLREFALEVQWAVDLGRMTAEEAVAAVRKALPLLTKAPSYELLRFHGSWPDLATNIAALMIERGATDGDFAGFVDRLAVATYRPRVIQTLEARPGPLLFTPSLADERDCANCERPRIAHYSGPFADECSAYCNKYEVPVAPAAAPSEAPPERTETPLRPYCACSSPGCDLRHPTAEGANE